MVPLSVRIWGEEWSSFQCARRRERASDAYLYPDRANVTKYIYAGTGSPARRAARFLEQAMKVGRLMPFYALSIVPLVRA